MSRTDEGPRPASTTIERAAVAVAAIACAIAVARYLYVAFVTVPYPFQLEWMEGGVIDVVARVRRGEPIYVVPSVEYVPFIYPPLYFVVVAALSHVAGVGLFAGRVVSFLATAGVCALAFDYVRRATRSHRLGIAAVSLFLATYVIGGQWLHLARVDSLYLVLIVAALHALRFGTTARSAAIAGGLACLALFTKQSAAIAFVTSAAIFALADARRAAIAGAVFAAASLIGVAVLEAVTRGWFVYYTLDLPSQHALMPGAAMAYVARELPFVSIALVAGVLGLHRRVRRDRSEGLRDVAVPLGLVASALLSFMHHGAYDNVLIPMYLALAIAMPIGLSELRMRRTTAFAAVAVAVQIGLLWAPLDASLPAPGSARSGERFLAWVAALEGDVLMPDHQWLQTRAGKRSYGLGMAARDVLRAREGDRGRVALEESLVHAFTTKRFSTVVLSQEDYLAGFIDLFYRPAGTVDGAPAPVTGEPLRPRWVWTRRD